MFQLESHVALKQKDLNANVYISVGALEEEYVAPIEEFIFKLRSRNYASLSLQHQVMKSADHEGAFPMSAMHGINWLSNLMNK
jgi:hypothetical protein